jgi:hypothetical protein
MDFWQWVTCNSAALQIIAALVGALLSLVTIGVLYVTWRAIKRQAKAAEKLTEATQQQIETSKAQASAAKEQVEVARRQITESLRPILTFSTVAIYKKGYVKNEGCGVALDVWYTYGTLAAPSQPERRYVLDRTLIPPGGELEFAYGQSSIESKGGLLIVYESLAGRVSATHVSIVNHRVRLDYHEDVTEWARHQTAPLSISPMEQY